MDEQNTFMEHLWRDDRVKRNNQEKGQIKRNLTTTHPTLTGLELNPVLCGESPAANHLSHGTHL